MRVCDIGTANVAYGFLCEQHHIQLMIGPLLIYSIMLIQQSWVTHSVTHFACLHILNQSAVHIFIYEYRCVRACVHACVRACVHKHTGFIFYTTDISNDTYINYNFTLYKHMINMVYIKVNNKNRIRIGWLLQDFQLLLRSHLTNSN